MAHVAAGASLMSEDDLGVRRSIPPRLAGIQLTPHPPANSPHIHTSGCYVPSGAPLAAENRMNEREDENGQPRRSQHRSEKTRTARTPPAPPGPIVTHQLEAAPLRSMMAARLNKIRPVIPTPARALCGPVLHSTSAPLVTVRFARPATAASGLRAPA